jgi:hypothetical protein
VTGGVNVTTAVSSYAASGTKGGQGRLPAPVTRPAPPVNPPPKWRRITAEDELLAMHGLIGIVTLVSDEVAYWAAMEDEQAATPPSTCR